MSICCVPLNFANFSMFGDGRPGGHFFLLAGFPLGHSCALIGSPESDVGKTENRERNGTAHPPLLPGVITRERWPYVITGLSRPRQDMVYSGELRECSGSRCMSVCVCDFVCVCV